MKDIAFREKELKIWTNVFPEAEVFQLERVGHYVQEEGAHELSHLVKRFLNPKLADTGNNLNPGG